MEDVDCPYCGLPQEINHDDGYGYSEDEIHEQECGGCGKTFVYQTIITFDYDAAKADCLNGGEHQYMATFTVPEEYSRMRCDDCGHERAPTPAEMGTIKADRAEFRRAHGIAAPTPPDIASGEIGGRE